MGGQICTEIAVVHCYIPGRIFNHSLLMSLLVKGWKDHRLSIRKDCQSQGVSNSAVIYTRWVKNRMVLKCCLLCLTACAITQIKYMEQRFKGKNKFWRRNLDIIMLHHLPFSLMAIIKGRNQGTCHHNSQSQNDAIKVQLEK